MDIRTTLNDKKRFIFFIILATGLFALYIWIPVTFIPGNSLEFYISIEPWWGFVLLAILAVEVSFIITFRVFSILQNRIISKKGIVKDAATSVGSVFPSLLACPILAVAFLSFLLPATSIWTLVGYRYYIVGVAVVFMAGLIVYRFKKPSNCKC